MLLDPASDRAMLATTGSVYGTWLLFAGSGLLLIAIDGVRLARWSRAAEDA